MKPILVLLETAIAPLELECASSPASVDVERRTIAGSLIPYGETGVALVDGQPRRIRFVAGSHRPMRDRTPLVMGHDVERPIGILRELDAADPRELRASFSIDSTPDGDAALAQAASGSRAGLSAGALATSYVEAADGTLEASESTIVHVGLVAVPAFESAIVSRVAASHAERPPNERSGNPMDPTQLRRLLGLAEDATDEQVTEALASRNLTLEQFEAAHAETEPAAGEPVAATAAAAAPVERPVVLAARPRAAAPEVSAGRLVLAMLAAERGDRDAARLVEAALTTVVSTDVPGLMPAAQTSEILGGITVDRVLATRVAARRPLPATGMEISKPKWDTLPQGGWRANVPGAGEDDEIASNKPAVTLDSIDVLEWAYGVSLSYAVATRSSPDAIEAIYRAAVQDYYKAVEIKLAALLEADATATAAGAGVGAAIAASFSADNKAPGLLIVAPDVYGDLIDVMDTVPTYSDGSVSGAGMTGSIAGLEIVVSPYLTAGTEIVGPRGGIELRESDPIRLTANTIGALQVELGVTAFATFDDEAAADSYQQLTPAGGAPAGSSVAKATSKRKK